MENNTPPQVTLRARGAVTASPRNARTHSPDQVRRLADSLRQYGWTNPVLVDAAGEVVAGHGRLAAADLLWAEGEQIRNVPEGQVPVIELTGLTEADLRAYRIADNEFALQAGWDEDMLRLELGALQDTGFELTLTGFDTSALAGLMGSGEPAPPPPDGYKEQYGVIVICKDETQQKAVYEELLAKGLEVKVVVT